MLSVVCPGEKCEHLNDIGKSIYRDKNHMRQVYIKWQFDNLLLFLD